MSDLNQQLEHHHTADDLLPVRMRKFIPLLAIIIISLAVVGYISGLCEPSRLSRATAHYETNTPNIPNAVTYSELPTAQLRPQLAGTQSLSQLQFDRPSIFDVVVRTDEMKLATLADRSRNRAYDGAPPTIPHAVESQSVSSCLVCHGEGLKVGDRVASKMSHAMHSNCTQCHVEQAAVNVENTFLGVYRAGPGQRANPGSPPVIPHHTWMRENCNSCHGLVTRSGTRTTHPWLTNCTQCHAPSAKLDQLDFSGAK